MSLQTYVTLAERIKNSAQKAKYTSLIDSLQYSLREFFAKFDQDSETFNTDRATQVLNHYDMYHSYFKKHLRHTNLDTIGRIVDVIYLPVQNSLKCNYKAFAF